MVTAIVLIDAESHKIHDVAERLVEIEGIPRSSRWRAGTISWRSCG